MAGHGNQHARVSRSPIDDRLGGFADFNGTLRRRWVGKRIGNFLELIHAVFLFRGHDILITQLLVGRRRSRCLNVDYVQ